MGKKINIFIGEKYSTFLSSKKDELKNIKSEINQNKSYINSKYNLINQILLKHDDLSISYANIETIFTALTNEACFRELEDIYRNIDHTQPLDVQTENMYTSVNEYASLNNYAIYDEQSIKSLLMLFIKIKEVDNNIGHVDTEDTISNTIYNTIIDAETQSIENKVIENANLIEQQLQAQDKINSLYNNDNNSDDELTGRQLLSNMSNILTNVEDVCNNIIDNHAEESSFENIQLLNYSNNISNNDYDITNSTPLFTVENSSLSTYDLTSSNITVINIGRGYLTYKNNNIVMIDSNMIEIVDIYTTPDQFYSNYIQKWGLDKIYKRSDIELAYPLSIPIYIKYKYNDGNNEYTYTETLSNNLIIK